MHLSSANGSSSPCEIRFRNSESEKLTGSMYLVLLLISSSTLFIPLVLFNVWLQKQPQILCPPPMHKGLIAENVPPSLHLTVLSI